MITPSSRHRATCRRVFATTATIAIAATPFTLAVPAHAAGTNVIDIYVDDYYKDLRLPGMSVSLVNTATGSVVNAAGTTDSDGKVTFGTLDDGTYTAKVAGNASYYEKYSTTVTVNVDRTTDEATVDVVPKRANLGRIKGSVTQPGDNLSTEIQIFPASATAATIQSGATQPVDTVSTYAWGSDSDSSLSATWVSHNLPVGSYKVVVGDRNSNSVFHKDPESPWYWVGWSEYASSVWVGAPTDANTADGAATITVTDQGKTASTAALLPRTSELVPVQATGTLTGSDGTKLDGVRVSMMFDYDGYWYEETSTYTDKNGVYKLRGTYQGTYTLRFADSRGDYKTEFLDDVPAEQNDWQPDGTVATRTFTTGSTLIENAVLAPRSIDRSTGITGTFTDDLNRAHDNGDIEIFDLYGNNVSGAWTHRDGRWEKAASSLPPGQYKVYANDYYGESDLVSSWYGGKTYQSATVVTVPVTGTVNIGGSKLQRYGSVAGNVTLPQIAQAQDGDTLVTLYDAKGKAIDSDSDEAGEPFRFRVAPGTYYLGAEGRRWNPFSHSTIDPNATEFIPQFWKGAYALRNATPIKVTSGGKVTGVNFTLGRTLAATARPTIAGAPAVGTVLKASAGAWNVSEDVTFSYTWKRGTTLVSTAPTYKVVAADRGQRLTLTVSAKDTTATFLPGASSTSVAVPKLTAAQAKVVVAQTKVSNTNAAIASTKASLASAKKAGKKAAVAKAKKRLASLKKQLKKNKAALAKAQKAAK